PDMWVRANEAFDAVVDAQSFYIARGIIQERCRSFTDQEMLDRLRSLVATNPLLTSAIIDEAEGLPSSSAYRHRFGSLINAYRQIGFNPGRDVEYIAINQALRKTHPKLLGDMIQDLETMGASVRHDLGSGTLVINGLYTASLYL